MIDHDPGGKISCAVPKHIVSEAVFSPCRQYRYILHRRWEPTLSDHSIMFIMLNPSTATEDSDDPTVRKCRSYATRWGYNHLIIGNIMGYRLTDPRLFQVVADPVGPDNATHLRRAIQTHDPMIVCAWGCLSPRLAPAGHAAIALLREMHIQPFVLRLNQGGDPAHPLYLPLLAEPIEWGIF